MTSISPGWQRWIVGIVGIVSLPLVIIAAITALFGYPLWMASLLGNLALALHFSDAARAQPLARQLALSTCLVCIVLIVTKGRLHGATGLAIRAIVIGVCLYATSNSFGLGY